MNVGSFQAEGEFDARRLRAGIKRVAQSPETAGEASAFRTRRQEMERAARLERIRCAPTERERGQMRACIVRAQDVGKRSRRPEVAGPGLVGAATAEEPARFARLGLDEDAGHDATPEICGLCKQRPGVVAKRQYVTAVRPERDRAAPRRQHGAMARQIERPVEFRRDFRRIVGKRRRAKAGMELAREEASPRTLAAFDDDGAQTGPRQDDGRSQSFRARADDRRIVAQPKSLALPHRLSPRGLGDALTPANVKRPQAETTGQRKGRKRPIRAISALG